MGTRPVICVAEQFKIFIIFNGWYLTSSTRQDEWMKILTRVGFAFSNRKKYWNAFYPKLYDFALKMNDACRRKFSQVENKYWLCFAFLIMYENLCHCLLTTLNSFIAIRFLEWHSSNLSAILIKYLSLPHLLSNSCKTIIYV